MTAGASDGEPRPEPDLPISELNDRDDREELRDRYYGLLQELRVVLPGVQVLLAFLFAVPFAPRFEDLGSRGRATFGISILAALLAVVCMITPAALHRFGERTARRDRLRWSIRSAMVGLAFLALALVSAMWTVADFVYGPVTAMVVALPVAVTILAMWWGLPRLIGSGR